MELFALGNDVDAFDVNATGLGFDGEDLARLAFILSRDNHHVIALSDIHFSHIPPPHRTSGAREIIFI